MGRLCNKNTSFTRCLWWSLWCYTWLRREKDLPLPRPSKCTLHHWMLWTCKERCWWGDAGDLGTMSQPVRWLYQHCRWFGDNDWDGIIQILVPMLRCGRFYCRHKGTSSLCRHHGRRCHVQGLQQWHHFTGDDWSKHGAAHVEYDCSRSRRRIVTFVDVSERTFCY